MGPGMLNTNIQKSHKFRFVASSAFNGTISSSMLLGAAGAICTVVNTTLALKNQAVRLKTIELWAPPASQGSASTCSVEFTGTNNPNREFSDTSVSVMKPAHLKCSPPEQSLASFWQLGPNDANMFILVCPGGTIIDVDLALIETDQESNATRTVATGVLGKTYYLALDHSVSDLLVPVSLQTTV